jgi:ferredoxin
MFTSKSGLTADANEPQEPISDEVYYIVSDKCTECVGFHDEPQCAAVCPVDCCVDDDKWRESKEELFIKKDTLHLMI